MTKRKTTQPTPPPSPVPLEARDDLIEGQWQKGTWNGIEKLECIWCHWDTLKGMGAAIERKLNCIRCGPQPGEPRPHIPLYDARGRLMNPIQESDT